MGIDIYFDRHLIIVKKVLLQHNLKYHLRIIHVDNIGKITIIPVVIPCPLIALHRPRPPIARHRTHPPLHLQFLHLRLLHRPGPHHPS